MKSNIYFYYKRAKLEKGFTLIELLIAMVIIGILAGVSVPSAFI